MRAGRQVDADIEQRRIRAGRRLVEAEVAFLLDHGWCHNQKSLTWSHPSIEPATSHSLWQAVARQKALLSQSFLSALQRAMEQS